MYASLKLSLLIDQKIPSGMTPLNRAMRACRCRDLSDFYGSKPPRCWVARVTGRDERGRLLRKFLRGATEWGDAKADSRRGVHDVFLYFLLAPGYFEVCETPSWTEGRRYFLHAPGDGTTRRIPIETIEEVFPCATRNAVSASTF